jgi:WD40 repeat protein
VSIAPTDVKFVTCSDDQTIKLWDLATCELEATLTGVSFFLVVVAWLWGLRGLRGGRVWQQRTRRA